MRRVTLAAGAAAAVATATLSGCGDLNSSDLMNSMDDYCAAVQDLKDSGLEGDMTSEKMSDLRGRLADLESMAPDSVAGDYATLVDGFDRLDAVLADAGLSISDMRDQETITQVMSQVSPEQAEAIRETFTAVGADLDAAGEVIEQEVQADCGITLDD